MARGRLRAVLSVVAALVLISLWLWSRRSAQPGVAAIKAEARSDVEAEMARLLSASDEGEPASPTPDVGLAAGLDLSQPLPRGMPLILVVTAMNQRAVNEVAEKKYAAQVETGAGATPRVRPSLDVQLGDPQSPWYGWVHFQLRGADGRERPLDWQIAPGPEQPPPKVMLDAETTEMAFFALSPEASRRIPAGHYEIEAVLETPAGWRPPGQGWTGRVVSEPLKFDVAEPAAAPSTDEQTKSLLAMADYQAFVGQWEGVSQSVERALALDPALQHAYTLRGDAARARQDWPGALEAYTRSLGLFSQKHPDSYESPVVLIRKVSEAFGHVAAAKKGPVK